MAVPASPAQPYHRQRTSRAKGLKSMDSSKRGYLLIRPARTEDHPAIRDFLLQSSPLYPDIEKWWSRQVVPSLGLGRRIVLVVEAEQSLEGLFIGKLGPSAKLCTLRLGEAIRSQGVGKALITEGLSRLIDGHTNRVHVTVSEAAEEGAVPFFESFGFRRAAVQHDRYRQGVDEFVYTCSVNEISDMVAKQLSRRLDPTLFGSVPIPVPEDETLVMSLRPEFAEAILKGRKVVEFRRRFSTKHTCASVVFYVSSPVKEFVFKARISAVEHNRTRELWRDYREEGGVSQDVFERYFAGTEYGYAIRLADVEKLPEQIPLSTAREWCPGFRPPQSFQTVAAGSALFRALNMPAPI